MILQVWKEISSSTNDDVHGEEIGDSGESGGYFIRTGESTWEELEKIFYRIHTLQIRFGILLKIADLHRDNFCSKRVRQLLDQSLRIFCNNARQSINNTEEFMVSLRDNITISRRG